MKRLHKQILSCLLLSLLILFLSACSPSVPSDLTAPPSTAAPEPTEHIPNALDGIGTICDVTTYADGYLVLSHTGLYTVDQNFENRERLGSPYNDPFDKCEEGTFLYRLTAVENYDSPYFENLYVDGEHIYFYCGITKSFFLDGEEVAYDDYDIQMGDISCVAVYRGAIYTLVQDNVFGSYLFRNCDEPLKITEQCYYRIFVYQDRLYLAGMDSYTVHEHLYLCEVHEDLTLDEPSVTNEEVFALQTEYAYAFAAGEAAGTYQYRAEKNAIWSEPDKYGLTEILGYRCSLSRTDGEKVETLECEGLDELVSDSENFFWFIKEDKQVIIITQKDKRVTISTLDFTVKE